jgi:hypothetical protein
MTMGPPGWGPHKITARLDGWIGNEDRIPAAVAEMIARALPLPSGYSVADICARMIARQRMHDRMRALGNG